MGIPNYPKDLATEWQKQKRQIRNNFTSANTSNASTVIATSILQITGQLTIAPGGALVGEYSNGVSAFYLGPVTNDGVPGEAVIMRRADGTEALRVEGLSNTESSWSLLDVAQNVVVSDDGESGVGLGRPYISVNFGQVSGTLPGNTTSSYVTIHKAIFQKQHPNMVVNLYYDVGSLTGDIRIQATDTTPTTSTVFEILSLSGAGETQATFVCPGEFLEEIVLEIQTRVATGTGSCGVSVLGSYGTES